MSPFPSFRGCQETPYANRAQTNATELCLASCPVLEREEAESDLPGDATKPNADLQRYREPQRMVVLNLSLKTYFQSFFFTTARLVAASNAGRGSKLQRHGADYIPVPTLRNLTQVYAMNDLVCPLNRSTDVFTLRPSGLSRPVRNEAQRQKAVNCRIPSWPLWVRGIFEDMIKEFDANVTRFEVDFVLV